MSSKKGTLGDKRTQLSQTAIVMLTTEGASLLSSCIPRPDWHLEDSALCSQLLVPALIHIKKVTPINVTPKPTNPTKTQLCMALL